MSSTRKIIHIDMDAFFAAVEQRDFPKYHNKPLIVGGLPFSRGVVAACSHLRSPKIRHPFRHAIFQGLPSVPSGHLRQAAICTAYWAVSRIIRHIFANYTDMIEPVPWMQLTWMSRMWLCTRVLLR